MSNNYLPIENYGIIGNLRTAALVGLNGSIDWLCLPHFDSPSVFAALLDDQKGGRFRIAPQIDGVRHKQFYWPDTNVLITRFLHPDGIGEVEDYMPVGSETPAAIIRRVRAVRGQVPFRLECNPAFDYARAQHTCSFDSSGARFDGPGFSLMLASPVQLQREHCGVNADFTLSEGQKATFVLQMIEPGTSGAAAPDERAGEELFRSTVEFWRRWLSQSTYTGRWRDMVERSALTLKLLQFEPTGAMVAAPTTSLPEIIGGSRNWDYRYTWIRDAAFSLYALLRIGFEEEATRFMDWLKDRYRWPEKEGDTSSPLQLMYSVEGLCNLSENTLDHLEGYRGSSPVRIGNAAHEQLQLDIYGELLDAVYLHNKHVEHVGHESWATLRRLIDWVCDNWKRDDEGIWEVRTGRHPFVHSKLMCWVAIDRGLRLAEKRSLPADRNRWLATRDEIYEQINERGWNKVRKSFVQAYDTDALDATALLMPLVFFLAPNDPRMLSTIEAIRQPLSKKGLVADGLVFRYDRRDAFRGKEGTFNICTFWLVEALTRAGRTNPPLLDDARLLFEQMLNYANHLGLYAEQTGYSGEALGNFPQAFTHLALISAAVNLDAALSEAPHGEMGRDRD